MMVWTWNYNLSGSIWLPNIVHEMVNVIYAVKGTAIVPYKWPASYFSIELHTRASINVTTHSSRRSGL